MRRDHTALIAELNDIFSAFDRIVDLFDCERIKSIGDAYMAVSGVNLAARMEAMAKPMQIMQCENTYQLLKNDFLLTDCGEIEIKGFETQTVYSLDGELRGRN